MGVLGYSGEGLYPVRVGTYSSYTAAIDGSYALGRHRRVRFEVFLVSFSVATGVFQMTCGWGTCCLCVGTVHAGFTALFCSSSTTSQQRMEKKSADRCDEIDEQGTVILSPVVGRFGQS